MSEEEKQEEQVEEKQEEKQEEQQEEKQEEAPKEPDKFEELMGKFNTLAESVTNLQSSLQKPDVEKKEEPLTEDQFWSDPMGHINKIFETKIKGVLNPVTDTLFATQKENVRNKYKDFNKYETEIDQFIKMVPDVKNQPGTVEKVYKMVKGLHSDDLEAEIRKQLEQEHIEKTGSSLEGGSPPSDKKSPKVTLTPEEKRVAHQMMPEYTAEKAEEEYAKWKR